MTQQLDTRTKKQIRLKGLRTPRVFLYLQGWMDARKQRIWLDEKDIPHSLWLKRKGQEFTSYSARLLETTKQTTAAATRQLIQGIWDLEYLRERQKQDEVLLNAIRQEPPDRDHLRQIKKLERQLHMEAEQAHQLSLQNSMLLETLRRSEHETEQMLLNARSLLESRITTYLQGAGKEIKLSHLKEVILKEDTKPRSIYIRYNRFPQSSFENSLDQKNTEGGSAV